MFDLPRLIEPAATSELWIRFVYLNAKRLFRSEKAKENLEGSKEKIFVHQRANGQIADKVVEIRGENITLRTTAKKFSGEEISENY